MDKSGQQTPKVVLTQEERDRDVEESKKKKPMCLCGKQEAIGSWGLQIGRRSPFHYTPKYPYCRDHLSDMIDGLELVVKDLKSFRENLVAAERKSHEAERARRIRAGV